MRSRLNPPSLWAVSFVISMCAAGASRADDKPATAPAPAPAASAAASETAVPAGEKSLDGIWMFDASRSDDPRKIMAATGHPGGGEGGGRRWGGGGGMGMGGGGRHGGGGGDDGGAPPAEGDANGGATRRGPSAFRRVMAPAKKVVIEMLADQVKVTEDEGAPRPYAIADSLKAHGHDLVTQDTSARWKGGRLEMTEQSGFRGSLVETYELSKDGMTLFIRAHRTGGPEGMPAPTFTRVYTRYTGE